MQITKSTSALAGRARMLILQYKILNTAGDSHINTLHEAYNLIRSAQDSLRNDIAILEAAETEYQAVAFVPGQPTTISVAEAQTKLNL